MTDAPLKELYCGLLRIRMVEEKIVELYPEQEMRCPVHLCIGQEAVAVGVSASLRPDDRVLSNHRSHGHYLAKGGDLKAMMAEIYGKATGCAGGKGGSMHLVDLAVGYLGSAPIVGSTIPIATGVAFAARMKREDRVTVSYLGEGATEEGVFHESVNFALLKDLPIVYVCENNLYSVYSPMSVRQPASRKVYELAKGHGMETHQADGNDVVQVFELAEKAIQKAREGRGPTFLEFATYRWREHCGPNFDNDIGYRTEAEFLAWQERCPVRKAERLLEERDLLDSEEIRAAVGQIEQDIEAAVHYAKESPFPDPQSMMQDVYAD